MDRPPPVLLVILDGLGDRAWPELDGLTPLEAARTPALDELASASATGILHSLGPGRAPGTDLAHFVLFGYPPDLYPGRVVFEAAGCGLELSPADVAFRALFSRVRREPDGTLTLLDHFAEVDDALCRALASELVPFAHRGLSVSLEFTGERQGVITVSGGASEDVTDCDPFYPGRPLAAVLPLAEARDPAAARLTAGAVTAFLAHAYQVFRAVGPSKGQESLFLVAKWTGRKRELPPFAQLTGMRGTIVSHGTLFRGIASELDMELCPVLAIADPRTEIETLLAEALRLLAEGAEFVHVHSKAPDEAGHAKDPSLKRDVIASLDQGLSALLEQEALHRNTLVVVTSDHGTPAGTGLIHSGDPVPLLLSGPGVRTDSVTAFSESACAAGCLGQLRGEDLMPVLLSLRGTTRYLGARLSAQPGLHWPTDYERFTVE